MFARGEVGPLAGNTAAAVHEPDHETAPRRVLNVPHAPSMPFAAAVGEILPADGLGIVRKAAREIGGGLLHGATSNEDGPAG